MRTVSAGMQAHLDGVSTTLAMGWKLHLVNGTLMGFTTADKDASIDLSVLGDTDGAITYLHTSAFDRSDFQQRSGMSVSNTDVFAILNADQITDADLRAGVYDHANVKVFLYNYEDITMDPVALVHGQLSDVTFKDNSAVAELRDIIDRYNVTKIVELYTHDCLADLGDGRCRVQLDPPVWLPNSGAEQSLDGDASSATDESPASFNMVKPTVFNDRYFRVIIGGVTGGSEPAWNTGLGSLTTDGTVTWEAVEALQVTGTILTVTDQANFTILSATDAVTGFFDQGVLTWTGGNNTGVPKTDVKVYTNVGSPDELTIELYLPAPFTLQAGDTFTMTAGCDKGLETCVFKFLNRLNFRGHGVFIPGDDFRFRTPDAPS